MVDPLEVVAPVTRASVVQDVVVVELVVVVVAAPVRSRPHQPRGKLATGAKPTKTHNHE